jgi:NAD-dependent deacetylase
MHGSLFQSRCTRPSRQCPAQPFADQSFYEAESERDLPTCKTCGQPIRPHIVWFGEVPLDMDGIYRELDRATTLLVVGTSGSVYPAAGFVNIANHRRIRTIYVGPEEPLNAKSFDDIHLGPATEILPSLFQ